MDESHYHVNGSGDSNRGSLCGLMMDDPPPYVMRRLRCGIPVPVFLARDDNSSEEEEAPPPPPAQQPHSASRLTKEVSMTIIKDYLCCPICHDPFIETTVTNCGHKFCKECISKYTKEKADCPVCSTLLSSFQRSYSDDCFIESQLCHLPPALQQRFRAAQKSRVDKLLKDQKRKHSFPGIFREMMDSALVLVKNKRASSSKLNLARASSHAVNLDSVHRTLAVLIVVGLLGLLWWNIGFQEPLQFIQYLFNAIRNYDGTIPQAWLHPELVKSQISSRNVTTKPLDDKSAFRHFSDVVNRFNLLSMIANNLATGQNQTQS